MGDKLEEKKSSRRKEKNKKEKRGNQWERGSMGPFDVGGMGRRRLG